MSQQTPYRTKVRTAADIGTTIHRLRERLSPCIVCPFRCKTDRFYQSTGRCKTGSLPKVASFNLHHGEEPPISGHRGSGTIFFSGCSLDCAFCQNYPISQMVNGKEMDTERLAGCMLMLQNRGAHNINLVTPTHFVPQIVEALWRAVERGFIIPLVYNSSGYDDNETLRLLEGIVDIYLVDMKYGSNENAMRYSAAPGYVEINRAAVREMYRQVGELVVDNNGIAQRGLLIRHLVLPNNISDTEKVLEFVQGLSPTVPISLMSQYFPAHKAVAIPELKRKVHRKEYQKATKLLDRFGLVNGWTQPL